jgi:hypothetical protein
MISMDTTPAAWSESKKKCSEMREICLNVRHENKIQQDYSLSYTKIFHFS